jgi:predicted DCC family thiol-disulfide oxidoreductase YuxK
VSSSRPSLFPDPVLLFDGECSLCQRIVRALLRVDRAGRLRYAPLQSLPAQTFLRARGLSTEDFDTLVFVTDWARRETAPFLLRTAGVIAALRVMGGTAGVLAFLLRLVPAPWRDAAYRFVGHTRYRIFGPWRPRPLARAEWAARFIG